MNGRVCKRFRKVLGIKVGKKPSNREHLAIMASKTATRPSCVCDSLRRTYQRAKTLWHGVSRSVRRLRDVTMVELSTRKG